MMKRFLLCLMTLALLLSVFAVTASAEEYENDAAIWSELQLHPLYVQSGSDVYSDVAEEYYTWWWEEEDSIDDTYYAPATINMRGFAMSPNGDYAYLGTLNGGDGLRGVVVFNTVTGMCTDLYYHHDQYPDNVAVPGHGPFSYAKGIDTDTSGYVYVGFAFSNNYNVANLGIAKQEDDGTLTEVSFTPIWENGAHGDTSGTHVGVNGVDVVTIGEKTYCYVVVNYDYDALYCFDVTDPTAPVLNTEFGTDGCINFSASDCPVAVEGHPVNELQYLDVEEDGTIWLVMYSTSGTNGVMCITPDGTECTEFREVGNGDIYSISIVGDFMLCGAKNGTYIFVVDKETGDPVTTLSLDAYGDRITRMAIRNGVLYVCDAGADSNAFNAIHAGALTESGRLYLQNVMQSLNGELETEAPEETADPADTDADLLPVETDPTDVPETKTDETEDDRPDTDESEAAETKADESSEESAAETEAVTDKPVEEDSGCASLLLSGGSVILLVAAAFVTMKKR